MADGIEQWRKGALWRYGAVAASVVALAACGVNNDRNLLSGLPDYGVELEGEENPTPTLVQARAALTPNRTSGRSAFYAFNGAVVALHTGAAGARVFREFRRANFSFGAALTGIGPLRITLGDIRFISGSANLPQVPALDEEAAEVLSGLDAARDSYNALSAVPDLSRARLIDIAASRAPEAATSVIRGGALLEGARTYSAAGLWAMQYDEGDFDDATDDYVYGVYAYGLLTPPRQLGGSGTGSYSGGTLGYLVTLTDGVADDTPYFLSGQVEVTVDLAASEVDVALTNLATVGHDNTPPTEAWYDITFNDAELVGNEYGAFEVALSAAGLTVGGTAPATEALVLAMEGATGFVQGRLFGFAATAATGVSAETAGVWGIDATNIRLRASFSAADADAIARPPGNFVSDFGFSFFNASSDNLTFNAIATLRGGVLDALTLEDLTDAAGGETGLPTARPVGFTQTVSDAAANPNPASPNGSVEDLIGRAALLGEGGGVRFDSRTFEDATDSFVVEEGVNLGGASYDGGVARGALGGVRFGVWAAFIQTDGGTIGFPLYAPYYHGALAGDLTGAAGMARYSGRTVGIVQSRSTNTNSNAYALGGNAALDVDFSEDTATLTLSNLMVRGQAVSTGTDPVAVPWYERITFDAATLSGVGFRLASAAARLAVGSGDNQSGETLNFTGTAMGEVRGRLFGDPATRGGVTGPVEAAGLWRLVDTGAGHVLRATGAFGAALTGETPPPPPEPEEPEVAFDASLFDSGLGVEVIVGSSFGDAFAFTATAATEDTNSPGALGAFTVAVTTATAFGLEPSFTLTTGATAATTPSSDFIEETLARAVTLDTAGDSGVASFEARVFDPTPTISDTHIGGAILRGTLTGRGVGFGLWGVNFTDGNGDDAVFTAGYYHGGMDGVLTGASGTARYVGRAVGLATTGTLTSDTFAVKGNAQLDVAFGATPANPTANATATLTLLNLRVQVSGGDLPWYESIAFTAGNFDAGATTFATTASVAVTATVGTGDVQSGEGLELNASPTGTVEGRLFGASMTTGGVTGPAAAAGLWRLDRVGSSATVTGSFGAALSGAATGGRRLVAPDARFEVAAFYMGDEGIGGALAAASAGVRGGRLSGLTVSASGVASVRLEREAGSALSSEAPAVLGEFGGLSVDVDVRSEGASAGAGVVAGVVSAGGLSYSGYGVWGMAVVGGESWVIPYAVGALPTPASDIPVTGTATYSGGAVGVSGAYALAGSAVLAADFDDSVATLTLSDVSARRGGGAASVWHERLAFAGARISGNSFSGAGGMEAGLAGEVEGVFFGPEAIEAVGLWRVSGGSADDAFGSFGVAR